ncbi:hypothetical protein ACQJBY_035842 [Aegilops geniculata]
MLWDSPKAAVIRIKVLVSLVAGVLLLLAIFGSQRRRSRNWLLQNGVFGAFTLSFSVATYILGSMQSSLLKSTMYPIWAVSLIMLHGCTDSVTAYSLEDNKQLTRSLYQAVMYSAYAFFLLISVRTRYTPALFYMVLLAFVRYAQRFAVCHLASNSYNWNKIVADHMYEEQAKGVFVNMEHCSYLVEWPVYKSKFDAPTYATQFTTDPQKDDEVIDIGKIWQCKEALVSELKDACLSFSLFHLLRRRYFGFACDESKERARNFVFEGLLVLSADAAMDYNRVFKVLEVELAYTYDFFFTKYAVIYYGSMAATVWSLFSVIGLSITACITAITSNFRDDVVITLVILVSTALLEFLQLLFYWMGIWGRVSFVCQSIREEARSNRNKASTGGLKEFLDKVGVCLASCIMGLKRFLAKIGVRFAPYKHYWQHKLGQYSLLDSVSHNPNLLKHRSACRLLFISCLMGTVVKFFHLMDFRFFHQTNVQALRVRKKAGESVKLPDEVKKAVICSLKSTDGKLSNGRSSLESNGAQCLLWACEWEIHLDPSWSQRKQSQTHIILTWHIATCYCEMLTLSPENMIPFSIATKLSKYCAYLVVSAPKLLPGHHYDTTRKFDAAAVEAVTFLQRAESKYEAMKSSPVPDKTEKIFGSGVKLGKQLEDMEEGARWQVMADFWAEIMLYLAPSDNVEEHIEQLANGGEFITHLWALLSHAGILERDQEYQGGVV